MSMFDVPNVLRQVKAKAKSSYINNQLCFILYANITFCMFFLTSKAIFISAHGSTCLRIYKNCNSYYFFSLLILKKKTQTKTELAWLTWFFMSSALVGATCVASSYEGILRVSIFSISDPDASVELNHYGDGNLTGR